VAGVELIQPLFDALTQGGSRRASPFGCFDRSTHLIRDV
jgi:hypothetical protein